MNTKMNEVELGNLRLEIEKLYIPMGYEADVTESLVVNGMEEYDFKNVHPSNRSKNHWKHLDERGFDQVRVEDAGVLYFDNFTVFYRDTTRGVPYTAKQILKMEKIQKYRAEILGVENPPFLVTEANYIYATQVLPELVVDFLMFGFLKENKKHVENKEYRLFSVHAFQKMDHYNEKFKYVDKDNNEYVFENQEMQKFELGIPINLNNGETKITLKKEELIYEFLKNQTEDWKDNLIRFK